MLWATWEELIFKYLTEQGITPYFKFPNEIDTNNVWLHDEKIYPVSAEGNDEAGVRKPLAAGGFISISFKDAIKYLQLNMMGHLGKSEFLSKEFFHFAHCGLPEYSLGWGCRIIDGYENISHRGNVGGRSWCLFNFITSKTIGVVIMSNAGDLQTGEVIIQLKDNLFSKYMNEK